MKVVIGENERYYDAGLIRELDQLKTAVQKDWDGILLMVGREGVGKSTFAFQVAAYLDPEFTIDQVCWAPEVFSQLINRMPKYRCVVLDEAHLLFANKSAVGHLQRVIISLLTMIRSKNLFIIIVSPTIFDLSKYLVVHRAMAAFRCYHHGMERGYWSLYGDESKLKLYVRGRRDNDWSVAKPDMRGRFTKWFPIDRVEYNQRKDAAIAAMTAQLMGGDKRNKQSVDAEQRVMEEYYRLWQLGILTEKEVGRLLNKSERTIRRHFGALRGGGPVLGLQSGQHKGILLTPSPEEVEDGSG